MPFSSALHRASRARAKGELLPQATETRAQQARRVLLEKIGEFVIRHDLAVTAPNLATICGALSGSQPEVARALVQREAAGEPIDQRWLDTIARLDPDGHSRIAALETLSDKLEYALMRFAQTARAAQTETSDHRGAIGVQLEALAGPEGLAQVLDLSRAMLARIEQVESAMARSEAETERLRESLAKARIEADTQLHVAEKQLHQHASLLQPGEETKIQTAIQRLREAKEGEDYNMIRDLLDVLNDATAPFAQRIMDTSIQEALGHKRLSEV